jgi:xylose isomerase
MLVIQQAGGFTTGGVNFDAKIRRNSTDMEDLFIAHISAMDVFARSLMISDKILKNSDYLSLRKASYASYDSGKGAEFEKGALKLEDLRANAIASGEPKTTSGKQELFEQMINLYI